jgi:hypothetical protein
VPWLGLGLALVASGGTAIWALTKESAHVQSATPIVPQPVLVDAAIQEHLGVFEVDSIPRGATITIGGELQGQAPRTARVSADVPIRVRIELKGYLPFEEEFVAQANKTTVIRQRLTAAPATLVVETSPPGAQVVVAGQVVGVTPLERTMPAARSLELVLAKTGFDPIRLTTELVAGETRSVRRDLRESPKFGFATVNVVGTAGWADVYFRGARLGRNRTASGLVPLRLPVGAHVLRLRAGNGKEHTVSVTVSAEKTVSATVNFE